jgi:hypothetical protein
MLNSNISNIAANTQLNALAVLANNGYLRIYNGVQPVSADTPISSQTLLSELRLSPTAFGSAIGGVLTANTIVDDTSANNTGTATWFRILKSDGSTVLFDGSVGLSNANLVMTDVDIRVGSRVSINSFTYTLPKH